MFSATSSNSHTSRKVTSRQYLLSLFVALAFALMIHPSKAQAQVIGDLEVSIPFQFHAGNAKLPAGHYRIRPLDDSDLTVMEISNMDGSVSALFEVRDAKADSTPAKDELVFNKYGNRYFLAKLYQDGSDTGSEVIESRYEKTVSHQTMEAQEHVPARPTAARGN
jgi:hypothetical protein